MLRRCVLRVAQRSQHRPPPVSNRVTICNRPSCIRAVPRARLSRSRTTEKPTENPYYCTSRAPLFVLAAALAFQNFGDDDDDDEEDNDEEDDNDDEYDEDQPLDIEYEDVPTPAEFRDDFMRLKDAKRWVREYAENPQPQLIVEAFVPIALDVQERVMDVASVSIKDFADFYFYSGFFASVLVDLPVEQQLECLDRISDQLARYPERQQASRMMLVYAAMLTKEPRLVKWFKDNARDKLNREPHYANQPERIKKQIGILLTDLEQQLNENWAIVAAGHFIATRSTPLLDDIVASLDYMVKGADGQVPIDAIEEVLVRCVDRRGVAVRAFAEMDLQGRSPEVRDTIAALVKAAGLKMRPPRRKKRQGDEF